MGCKNKAYCDFCDARCGAYIVEKKEWLEICEKYGKWCSFEEIKGIPYTDAIEYVKNMPTFSPM